MSGKGWNMSLKTNVRLEGKMNDANLFIAHHILTPSQYKAMGFIA